MLSIGIFSRSMSPRSDASRSPSPELSRQSKRGSRRHAEIDDSDDDELRDSEEAEDDEDYQYTSRQRRKKRKKGSEFIIEEAEVDEDADEDEDAWDEDDGVMVSLRVWLAYKGIHLITFSYSLLTGIS